MLVSNAHESLTAKQCDEIDEIASLLGVTASYCSMGETDESDGYKGWDGVHPALNDGVGEGILYTTKHGALLAAMRLIKDLIP